MKYWKVLFFFTLCLQSLFITPKVSANEEFKIILDSSNAELGPWKISEKRNFETEKEISIPGNTISQIPEMDGKKHFYLKREFVLREIPKEDLGLRAGVISDVDKTYVNDTLVGSCGDMKSSKPQCYDKIRIYRIPREILQIGTNSIVVEVQAYFPQGGGIEQDTVVLEYYDDALRHLSNQESIKLLFLAIYLTTGGYFTFLFLRRRKEAENLFFGLFIFALVSYNFLRNQYKYELPLDFVSMKKMEYIILFLLMLPLTHFIRKFFDFPYKIPLKIIDGLILATATFLLFSENIILFDQINRFLIQPSWLLYIVHIFYWLGKRIYKKDAEAIYILIGFSILMLATILDILSSRGYIVLPRMVGYVFIIFVLSLATILANRFVKINEEVENLNANLELKVEERTKELNATLTTVNNLKVQQDADYFLTSLLLNPLLTNSNTSKSVGTEFLVQQKKKFEFKGRTFEIGGDFNIAANIFLNGNSYSVFMNGDAMGKSIQGAGGALVLGVVFNSVVSRIQLKPNNTILPEVWLHNTFLELQKVFEGFNGSMFVSIVLGLLDEKNGIMYCMNAEHPWSVLYRDGVASFIEEDVSLRKLGFPGNENQFSLQLLQLSKGDIIIFGSDGRDDIAIGTDEVGNKIVNENEKQFLNVVKQSHAELPQILNNLKQLGELTDDFSLLKIIYHGAMDQPLDPNANSIAQEYIQSKQLVKASEFIKDRDAIQNISWENKWLLGKLFFEDKKYSDALVLFKQLIKDHPMLKNIHFYASYCAKKIKDQATAIMYGEAAYLKNQSDEKTIGNLLELYVQTNDHFKAKALYAKLQTIQVDSKALEKYKSLIG